MGGRGCCSVGTVLLGDVALGTHDIPLLWGRGGSQQKGAPGAKGLNPWDGDRPPGFSQCLLTR